MWSTDLNTAMTQILSNGFLMLIWNEHSQQNVTELIEKMLFGNVWLKSRSDCTSWT